LLVFRTQGYIAARFRRVLSYLCFRRTVRIYVHSPRPKNLLLRFASKPLRCMAMTHGGR